MMQVAHKQEGMYLRISCGCTCIQIVQEENEVTAHEQNKNIATDLTNNPVIMALDDDQKESKTNHATHVWFQQPLFARLEDNHDMDTEVELSMRKPEYVSRWQQWDDGISSEEETSDVRVKDVDVSDTDTDSDSVESFAELVSNSTKGSTARSDTFEVLATS